MRVVMRFGRSFVLFLAGLAIQAGPGAADPTMECSGFGSQVEIGRCVSDALTRVDAAIETAFEFANRAAEELDQITERSVAVPALAQGQQAWSDYRDAHCEYVGATFGGGSGTGIAITACRVTLGRERLDQLMRFAR